MVGRVATLGRIIASSLAPVRDIPPYTAHLPSIFHATLLLLFLPMLLTLISPLLFPCVKYPVWNTHLVHGIPVPYCPC